MGLANAEETDRTTLEEQELLGHMISVNPTETTQQTADNDGVKEIYEVNKAIGEEHQKDSMTVVAEKIEETDNKIASNAEKGEPNVSIVTDVNEGLTTVAGKEITETEKNSDKHPLMVDEILTEPETKRYKLEAEQEIDDGEGSAWQHQFPPEFNAEMETYDCNPCPLWHFNDPYFIELAQVGNPPKDVAYVRPKTDKDA